MMDYKDLLSLAKATAKAQPNAPVAYSFGEKNYSYDALQSTLRAEFNELAGDFNKYRKNCITLFQLMEEVIDEVLPKKVMDRYASFAEVKMFSQGSKAIFKHKLGKSRAKKFVTRVGLAGIYEVFKLDSATVEVPMGAIGGAAQIGLEEFLDGNVDFSELLDIVLTELDEAIYVEVANALKAMVANLGAYNKFSTNTFAEKTFDQLLATAEAYGPATVYCTFEFAATMVPAEGWVSDELRNEKWANGYIANYKGRKVVVLPQSLTEDNSTKIIDPSWAYIFAGELKPVKLAFEGQTIVDEFKNADRSRDIQVYKKFGVATVTHGGYCAYQNTSLTTSNELKA